MSTTQVTRNTRNDPEFCTINADNNSNEYNIGSKGEVNGACVAGGIVGLVFGGPILGAITAAGAAYLAATKEGDAGEWSRKSGKAMNDLGNSLVKVEKENKLLDKTTQGLVKSARWVDKQMTSSKTNPEQPERETEVNLTS